MKVRLGERRFRLIDGLVVAAVALLSLKVLGFLAPDVRDESDPLPQFGRVIAHARSNYSPADPLTTGSIAEKPKEEQPAPEAQPAQNAAPAPGLFPPSATERSLLEKLGSRREELQQRSRDVEARERLIEDQERKLDERLATSKASDSTQKAVPGSRPEADPTLKNLVAMYETMKPKEAARVFERLPLDVLIAVVTPMNARKMSEVLAAMAPDKAEKLTVALAARTRGQSPDKAQPAGALPPGELPAIDLSAAPKR